MAAPLGQVVFKVPELGKQGYALEQQEQARQEKKRKERDTELYRTGGEKAFNDNSYKLQGIYKTDMETLFGAYEAAGERYEQTGDPSALREAKQIASQMKQKVADYNTQIGIPLARAAEADEVRWNGYVGSREDFDNNLNNILNPSDITASKYENGNLMYQIDGKWIPESATPRGQRQPNAANTVPVQKSVKLGTYFAPSAWEKEHKFLTINAESAEKANASLIREFEYELNDNPELQADVALSYAIAKRDLDPRNISNEVFIEVMDKFTRDDVFREEAIALYEEKLGKISANRFASQATGGGMFDADVKEGEAGETDKEPSNETSSQSSSFVPEIKFDKTSTAEEKRGRAEQRLENIIKKKDNEQVVQEPANEKVVQGPPTAEDEVVKRGLELEDTKLDEVTEAEQTDFERIPEAGITDTELTVNVDGKNSVVVKRTLPALYTDNLLEFEGGVSTDVGDPAAQKGRNENAPIVDGKKAHTNKGVTYDKFESWAKSIGMPKSQYEDRFLNLTNAEALAVAENVAVTKGANNFKNPVLVGMFTQNAWGGGGVYGKTTYSAEYQATLSMLKANGIEPSNKSKITEKDAAKIEALFNKNPKQFLDDYFDAYIISHTRMSALGKDEKGGAGFGKGAMVPIWMIYRNGWTDRANQFKKAIAEEIGVEYEPITPYNESRKYIKQGDKFVLVEERDGEFVPVGKTDWVDSYQPIN